MVAKIFYRLGLIPEKAIFKEMTDFYDGIVINANIATYYRSWVNLFLHEINKPYFIDLVTYIYALDPSPLAGYRSIVQKRSYGDFSRYFPEKIQNIVQERPLIPMDFIDDEKLNINLLKAMAKNLVQFQENLEKKDPAQKRLDEYEKWFTKEIEDTTEEPELKFITTPYFFFSSLDDPWYMINREIQDITKKLRKNKPVYSYLCFNKELLDNNESIEIILQDYNDFAGYVIWIDDFNEKKEKKKYLAKYVELVEAIKEREKECYVLYGGYFSLLLSYKGLDGYCRNIDYGEKKRVGTIPSGGGSPKKYYVSQINDSLSESKTRVLFSLYPKLFCKCEICDDLIISMENSIDSVEGVSEFFDKFSFDIEAKKHFIINHDNERNEILSEDLDAILENLMEQNKEMVELKLPDLIGFDFNYIERWVETLS